MTWPALVPPSAIFDLVAELEAHERAEVEARKHEQSFDRVLAESWLDRRRRDPGRSVALETPELNRLVEHLGDTIDIVIQVIAHCENPVDAIHLGNAMRHFGRIGQTRFRVPEHLQSVTRQIIKEIDRDFGLASVGKDDRKSARIKARQIVRKIEEAFSSTGVNWIPPLNTSNG